MAKKAASNVAKTATKRTKSTKVPRAPKAIVIDDAYALPSAETMRGIIPNLRSYLNRNVGAKAWFDKTFKLSGKASATTYFDPLLTSAKNRKLFWEQRGKCPDPGYLTDAIGDLVHEVAPKKEPLETIEKELWDRGWNIETMSQLPALEDVDQDVSLVVIDYVLQEDMPEDLVKKVEQSITFLRGLLDRSIKSGRCPLVILISSLPQVKQRDAKEFRKGVNLHGAFFRFIEKKSIALNLGPYVDGVSHQKGELDAFWRFHTAFQSALDSAVRAIQEHIGQLELQDLATLQVGQLSFERESLGDYLAWMCGQVLTTELQRSVVIAETSAKLPEQSYKVLLGHLEPTQGIPELFVDLSSVRTASGEFTKQEQSKRSLRFGDVFVDCYPKNRNPPETPPKYYLLISQTCDLLHCKLDNNQVLCIEGEARTVESTESGLLEATIKQMSDAGQIMLRSGKSYLQITWKPKNLITLQQGALERERCYEYVGRLNDIYALEAQQNALQDLSRIGVPIKPGYGCFFGEAKLRVFTAKQELKELVAACQKGVVLAALRLDKGEKHQLLLSMELRKWLATELKELEVQSSFPDELKVLAKSLSGWMEEDNFRIVCKQGKAGGVVASREVVKDDGKLATERINKFDVLLPQVTAFGSAPAGSGVRLSLELTRISDTVVTTSHRI
ncbi:hypothetical protein [Sinimarinibacterium flocculans]|uniref:hypothetical protein n=1 Tax=Sinimarinibacterium flocculans TaxID=985250 RepID=UPI003513E7E9